MKTILHSFAYTIDYLREQVADVADEDMATQPGGIVNHPSWVIGHLTFACQLLGGAVGLAPWLPANWAERFGPGGRPVGDREFYEPKDQALAILSDAQSRITHAVEQLNDAQLDQPFPVDSYRDVFPTIRHALTQVLVGHAAYHVGQVGDWRRAMGMAAMRRSYE